MGGHSGRPNNPTKSIIMANIKSIHCLLGDKPVVIEAESGYLPEARRVNVIREEVKQIGNEAQPQQQALRPVRTRKAGGNQWLIYQ